MLFEHDDILKKFADLVVSLTGHAISAPGKILETLKQHLGNIIALAAFCLGLWKWWVYREKILHERLFEYLRESDLRLIDGQQYVLDALNRPAPGQGFKIPLFANNRLRAILRRRRWDTAIAATSVETSTQRLLTQAMSSIEDKLKMADDAAALLRKQLATAHIISGSLTSANAQGSQAYDKGVAALTSFRTALQIPGHHTNVVAKELEAHQLRKLGMLPEARRAYADVEKHASLFADYRTQRLAIARSKRYQAEICQAEKSSDDNGRRQFRGSGRAAVLLYASGHETALSIRSNFAPYQGWDLIEQADLHLLAAFVAKNMPNAQVIERKQLDLAETCNNSVLKERKRWLWASGSNTRLKAKAELGLALVRRAKVGDYDWAWLLPPLEQPKHPTHSISAAGGQ